jgi:hypothetical protein
LKIALPLGAQVPQNDIRNFLAVFVIIDEYSGSRLKSSVVRLDRPVDPNPFCDTSPSTMRIISLILAFISTAAAAPLDEVSNPPSLMATCCPNLIQSNVADLAAREPQDKQVFLNAALKGWN